MPNLLQMFKMLGPRLSLAFALLAIGASAHAKDMLIVHGDSVVVYTGPGKTYRPLTVLPQNTEVQVGSQPVETAKGSFYKVLVKLSNRKKSIGYISTQDAVHKKNESDSEIAENMNSFADFPLAQKSVHVAYSQFKSQLALATLGYAKYIGPGFYLKALTGAFKTKTATSPLVGFEFGNDALLYREISGFISYSAGLFITPKENAIFVASKNDFSNFIVQAALGARYNFGSKASFALGGTQAALFNGNNSLVTWGIIAILEVGI